MGPSVHEFTERVQGPGRAQRFATRYGPSTRSATSSTRTLSFTWTTCASRRRAQPRTHRQHRADGEWLKKHPGPIITSRAHPDYPGLVEFPLEQVINDLKFAYFNSTAAYAIAYAIWLGVKRISVFGMDFTYANAHRAEKGRANVEFLLGIAAARGIKLTIPKDSSLMDACEDQPERLYGYDTLNVYLQKAAGDRCLLTFSEREKVATADEIEARYDHRQHPNPLLEGPAA
jgi:hypothetical protein